MFAAALFVLMACGNQGGNQNENQGPSFPVEGEAGIVNFCKALLPYYADFHEIDEEYRADLYTDLEPQIEADEEKGYLDYSFEGDGMESFQCRAWKRKDGSTLVGFYIFSHCLNVTEDGEYYETDSDLSFYTYDKKANALVSIDAPYDLQLEEGQSALFLLPSEGDDILYLVGNPDDPDFDFDFSNAEVLKFDGMKFKK